MVIQALTDAEQRYYILATDVPVAERTLILKQGETFGVFNEFGDIDAGARREEGLYNAGTRYLSGLSLSLASHRPLLLSSTVRRDNLLMVADLTNPDLYVAGQLAFPRGTLHINRTKVLWLDVCYEQIRIRNFSLADLEMDFAIGFQADYADIFEVRGQERPRRGWLYPPETAHSAILLRYDGLDGVTRRTLIETTPSPDVIQKGVMRFHLTLGRHEEKTINVSIACRSGTAPTRVVAHADAVQEAEQARIAPEDALCRVSTSNPQCNAWLESSAADLAMMLTRTPQGLYPYAGLPWFDTTFGRDGIITALETLWMWPGVARGVLAFLAHTQATTVSAERDSEPGKILHEARQGEMAALNEIPFGRYYGSVDATPLFVVLAGAYYRRTGDIEFIASIWPHVQAALDWIDHYGDVDGDGFVEYHRRSPTGLVHQGWKDSHDSVFDASGALAEGPIALCEVQGYTFAAQRAGAEIAQALGHMHIASRLREASRELRAHFQSSFWCADIGSYALALDGAKRALNVRTSNPGHCLYTGIAAPDHARVLLENFARDEFFSGWGIRTVAEGEARYNPMSYHNGSVWPHDNAILAAGASRYQCKKLTARILGAQFDASNFFELHRLPELFCGFPRRQGEGPTQYPVACSPQAWASAAVFLLLEGCLGVSIDAQRKQLVLAHPVLPDAIDEISIQHVSIGAASVDLTVRRFRGAVGVSVDRREGDVEVIVQS